jgi:hypothetical protein
MCRRSMEKLRIRLGNLFLRFIECSEYNPRAEDFVNIMTAKGGATATLDGDDTLNERLTTA